MGLKDFIKQNRKILLPGALLLPAMVFYVLAVRRIGFGIPCIFHRLTGFKCPGCGTTTMLVMLSRLDFKGALGANRFVFATLPFIAFELIFAVTYRIKEKKLPSWNEKLLFVYIGMLIAWGFIRNLWPL